jgi:hypothetical protein
MPIPTTSSAATGSCAEPDRDRPTDRKLRHDLKVLAVFIRIYCETRHRGTEQKVVTLKTHDLAALHGRPLRLCPACRKLLTHAFVKRTACPLDTKPMCKKCPQHCYAPRYREQIRAVMRYSGRRLLFSGRLDYLFHLWF